ncbi:hypothetical protein DSAG12_02775 [Promethearchaeum syntrophicum]|uniref:Uncharacterized protein n=1 Tax=Promethearchaeum syntrophicum TaxID=2594042 RepID=A0A5B9DCR2_9ARCH|nr:hypothetical protein [Candidatus Prometheoarchaeum syntrophicum]QEE16944.1 hypothetical protein DSAG12_02775 [Candidatus Prometheoarchaeum syntrophicum]
MKKIRLSKKDIRNFVLRFVALFLVFLTFRIQIEYGNTFILEFPSNMSSRITDFQVTGLESNNTECFFVVDYQVYNTGPFTTYSGKPNGANLDLYLPSYFSSINVNLENVSIYNFAGEGTSTGGVDKIKPGIHDYNTTIKIYERNIEENENYTLPDGDYYFLIGKPRWDLIYGVNITITGENYTIDYETSIEPWDSDVVNLGDPFLLFYSVFSIIVLIGPIVYNTLKKQPDRLKDSNSNPDLNI